MSQLATIKRRSGEVEYYSGSKRISKESYEKEAVKEAEKRKERISRPQAEIVKKTETQRIAESTPLSEFGKVKGTTKIVKKTGEVEYYAGGQKVYTSKPPSKYYVPVKTAAGQQVYRYTGVSKAGVKVKEVYVEPVPVYEDGRISGYQTGRSFRMRREAQRVAATKPPELGVYDVERQQTVRATPIESIGVQAISERGGFTPAKPVRERSVSELLRDPTTQYVYFRPTKEGVEPVAVFSAVKYEKPPAVIGVAPKKGFFDKIKASEIGAVGKEFKAGFGYRESPSIAFGAKKTFESMLSGRAATGEILSPLQAGFRRVAYVSGTTTGIVASSAFFWEGVGAKAASVTYQSPKVWSAVEKTGRALESPVGKYIQKSSLVLYGGFKAADITYAARTEGATGVAREGLKITRVAAGVGGFGKGFREQTAMNIEKTYYLVKGESRAATVIREGKTFETGLATRGKIYEFADTKLRRTFTFKDIARVSGKTKEVVRVISPYTTPLGKTERIATTTAMKAYLKGRTDIALRSKPFAEYTVASDIKALQTARSAVLTEVAIDSRTARIGVGGSRFQFKEARNIFGDEFGLKLLKQQDIYGVGKSSYRFIEKGRIVDVKGKVSTVDPRVTSKFGFKEKISRVGASKEIIDLTDEAGLVTRAATQKLTQNLVGKITPAQPRQIVKGAIPISKQVTKPVSVRPVPSTKKGVVRESVLSAKSIIPLESQQEFKEGYTVGAIQDQRVYSKTMDKMLLGLEVLAPQVQKEKIRTRIRTRDLIKTKPDVRAKEMILQEELPVVSQALLPKTKVEQQVIQRQEAALRRVQVFDTPFYPMRGVGFGLGYLPPTGMVLPPVKLPDFPRDSKISKMEQRKVSFPQKYTPTIEAELFDITGKLPSKAEIQSGLVLRPII